MANNDRIIKDYGDRDTVYSQAIELARQTYLRRGLEPPDWKDGEIPVTAEMKLLNGWTIANIGGTKTLVGPGGVKT